jgi:hypothetical protein
MAVIARPAEFGHCAVEQVAGRADEGPALQVFLVARLFADQHQQRGRRTFAPHRLRGMKTERTFAAAGGGFTQRGERM